MTAIVALESRDGVWIGGDSFFGGDDELDLMDRPKWTRHANHVIATSGPMRGGQIAESVRMRGRHRKNESDVEFLLRALAHPIRDALYAAGVDPTKPDETVGVLIVYAGAVYQLTDDFGVFRSTHGYQAIGAGKRWVEGAMAATKHLPPEERLRVALDAAAEHSNVVRGPFTIERA